MEAGVTIDDRYRLTNRLGRGGGGEVFSAWDDILKRDVAIKFVYLSESQSHGSPGFGDLRKEAQAASLLSHANIVSLYAIGVQPSGDPYLVMELVKGKTLDSIINSEGPLPVPLCVLVFGQLCDALGQAHKQEVFHRDIKPQNIMIGEGSEGEPLAKLLDFGLAKMTNSKSQVETVTGLVVGTPWYMSPEYCQGKKYDERCDIYSLGMVLYEALSGKRANSADNAVAAMHKSIHDNPEPFSSVCPQRSIPEALQNVIWRAIAKDPSKRYQSAAAMKSDLEAIGQSLERGLAMPSIDAPKRVRTAFKLTLSSANWAVMVATVLSVCVAGFIARLVVDRYGFFNSSSMKLLMLDLKQPKAAADLIEFGDLERQLGHRQLALSSYQQVKDPVLAMVAPRSQNKLLPLKEIVPALEAAFKSVDVAGQARQQCQEDVLELLWQLDKDTHWDIDYKGQTAELNALSRLLSDRSAYNREIQAKEVFVKGFSASFGIADMLRKISILQNDTSGALKWARQESKSSQDFDYHPEYWLNCADLHRATALIDRGRIEDAINVANARPACTTIFGHRAFREMLRLDLCTMTDALERFALSLAAHNYPKEAAKYFDEVYDVSEDDHTKCGALLHEGQQLIKAGNFEEAVDVLSRLVATPANQGDEQLQAEGAKALKTAQSELKGHSQDRKP
jgi:serine/threonine protein kinase